ncbi:MAG: protein kinase, partial [Thermodesulfobacteriota bacterium]|nr:protein kinase [Thermodesulfobacteriota bacterium]
MNKPKLFGRYYLIDKIAAGGMAEIYLAKTVSIDGFEKPLAIKMIHPKFAKDKIFVKKFTNEAKTIVKLSHGNIVPVFDMGIEAGKYYIAMEYIKGKNIKEVLRRCAEKGEELTLEFVIFIIIEVCKGLAYAHRKVDDDGTPLNIIHKDISPQNILISYEGDVKLVDFGIAQVADKGEEEIDESIEGKIRYMSPEQITGKPLDARSDNYSVGLLLYEMIAIDKFFNQNNVSELVRAVKEADNEEKVYNNQFLPDQIKPIIVKAINKNIDERYQQIEGLQLALTHYLYSIPSLITSYDISNFMNFLFEKEIHEEIELLKKTSLIDSSMKKITQILKKPDTRNLDYSLFSKEEISNIEDTFTSSVKKPEKTESPQDEELEYIQYGRIVPKGTIIFEQGEEGHHFYIIKEGKVRIYRQIGMLKNTLAVFGEGDFFGEMSLLNDEPR